MRKSVGLFLFILMTLFLSENNLLKAQNIGLKKDARGSLNQAIELYDDGRYLAAQQILNALQLNNLPEALRADVDFYIAMSALKLDAKDAFLKTDYFKKNHQVYSRMAQLDLLLADYQFEHNRFKEAIPLYESIQQNGFSQLEKDKLNFNLGYSYFVQNQLDKATVFLFKVKDSKSKYAPAANYYYGHIAYQEKNYPTALNAFRQVENNPMFQDIVPYYFVQIAFAQADYQQAVQQATTLYSKVSDKRKTEIAQILGVSLFNLEEFQKAIEYLEYYRQESGSNFTRNDYYQLAYAYMKTQEYQQAIRYFEMIKMEDDALSQNAFYNVGACYLQMTQKQFAGEAFYRAYQMTHDSRLREDALFNFAKVSYELSNDPYNKAIKALLEFMTNFPNSERVDEANEYLVNLFLTAKNYKGALEELERIPNKNQQLLAAYQKITFNRAIELFRERNYSEAIVLLKKSSEYNYDKLTRLKAQYWLAETYYQLKSYKMAAPLFEEIERNALAKQLENFKSLDYNLAYAYFQLDEYENAKIAFSKYVSAETQANGQVIDAYLRIADIYFIRKDFNQAIANYEKAEKISTDYLPYALYQKAQAHGGNGNLEEKIKILKAFVESGQDSDLTDDAFAELGTTYVLVGRETEAIQVFKALTKRFPNSPFYRIALLKTGLAFYNLDNNTEALSNLKMLVERFPGSQEAKEALAIIRNIYVESNNTDQFFAYIKDLPNAQVSSSAQDTILYRASENVYMNGNCQAALPGFTNYIQKFPEGTFATEAHFYRAECLAKANLSAQAADDYKYVSNNRNSLFFESALSKLAFIYRNQKKYQEALNVYSRLYSYASSDKNKMIGREGQMECYQQLNNHDSTLLVAQEILRSPNAEAESYQRAHLYAARAAFKTNQTALAQREYKIVEALMDGSSSAEAKYHLALIQYQIGDYKLSEKMIFELIKDYASYDYWVAKGFILLADVYVKYGNTFQAKHTLQSIIDNQSDTELINIALQKKQAILDLEKKQESEKQKNVVPADTVRLGGN